MMKGRRRANIIIAEGEQSSEKQTLVSVLPSASGCDLKAGAKQEKKKNRITIFEEMEPFI